MTWKTVSLNALYEVSDGGVVRRPNGYISVSLSDADGKKTRHYVHRLVAAEFLGGCDGLQVNHLNFDRADNAASNLEVVTCAENAMHSKRAGRYAGNALNAPRGEASCRSKINSMQARQIRERVSVGERKAHVARDYGITKQQVANIVNMVSWRGH